MLSAVLQPQFSSLALGSRSGQKLPVWREDDARPTFGKIVQIVLHVPDPTSERTDLTFNASRADQMTKVALKRQV